MGGSASRVKVGPCYQLAMAPGHITEYFWFSASQIILRSLSSLSCGYLCVIDAKGHLRGLTSISLFSTDITDMRSWERENAHPQPEDSSPSALQRAAWGISETESDLTYGEVEQRLDLLQEQLNRYKQ